MLAGDNLWLEGMKLFGEEIQKRNHEWWKGKKPMWQKHLSKKIRGEEFVSERGICIQNSSLRFIFSATKTYPTVMCNSAKQVFPVKNGKNAFTNETISR